MYVSLMGRCAEREKKDGQIDGMAQAKVRSLRHYEMLNGRQRDHQHFHSRFYLDYRTLPGEGLKCGEKNSRLLHLEARYNQYKG